MLKLIKKLLGYDISEGSVYVSNDGLGMYLISNDEDGVYTEVGGWTRVRGEEYATRVKTVMVYIGEL